MKFMKLGSKSDTLQADSNNKRYVAGDLATDIVVHVGDVKFYLHKFPLLSKSSHLRKLVSSVEQGNCDEIKLDDIPGGPTAFELCAKFCYGMIITLNAYNVVAACCAADYLEMYETVEKGNLVYKVDVFLTSSILRSWKDSIIVLQTSKAFLPMSKELKLISHCVEAIASKASVDVSKVDWSYTYNQKKISEEDGNDPGWNGARNRKIPKDWWVEDLCDLEIDLYKRVMMLIKNRGSVSNEMIGKALKAYAYRRFPASGQSVIPCNEVSKLRIVLDTIIRLLPADKGIVSCSFLLKMLRAAMLVECREMLKTELVKRIGLQLEEACVDDLLIPSGEGGITTYEVELVKKMIEEFMGQEDHTVENQKESKCEIGNQSSGILLSDASKLMVANLIVGYLAEIAKDPNLPIALFISIAEMVSTVSQPLHDGLYRAIDTYLKEHPLISKSERKRICRLMDCKKLSAQACAHAVQNERLPLRVVVQVLIFEQVRAGAAPGSATPDLPKAIKDLKCGSCGSSRSGTTNADEDWDAVASAEELRALRAEITALRVSSGGDYQNSITDKAPISKVKGLMMPSRILTKIWGNKGADNTRSDSSGSFDAEAKARTPPLRGRHSIS